jgi:hypothetical protein
MEHRTQVGVECPQCHARQFLEIQLDKPVENSPAVQEIRRQLEAWIASRCPDHLGPMLISSKN